MSQYRVAVVGARGVVGEALIEILAERAFPVAELFFLGRTESDEASKTTLFPGIPQHLKSLETFDFSQVDYAFFCVSDAVAAEFVPRAAESGCIVIDNSAAFRDAPDVPLVVPEVNAYALAHYRERHIIANPNCSTIQLVVALQPIHELLGICRVNIATYQSASGAGKAAIETLAKETVDLLSGESNAAEGKDTAETTAFNLSPCIGAFEDNGYTQEEMKLVKETCKIMAADIQVNPTAVRVPVFYGHCEAIHLETERAVDIDAVKATLRVAPGIILLEDHLYPTPRTHAMTDDAVFIGRVRQDITRANGLNFWSFADNVRKGAALNAVQIAECLIHL